MDGKAVILPKIGRVAMVEELRFNGSIREVTVSGMAGTWFACFCVEDGEEIPPVKNGPTVGVDVGVDTMATCSDGTKIENPKALSGALKRLRRVDQAIARSRKVHGRSNHSNRRERLYASRRQLHARVVNVRNDRHHKATTAIAKSCGRVVETLNVAGMMMNRRLARAIADAGMSGFLSKLEYKCSWYGAEYAEADRWYRSSKPCSHCGWKNEDLMLSDREWWCGGCGVLNDRDANAARNLERWPGLSFPASGRGDRVSPAKPAVVCEASNESGETSGERGVSDFIRFRIAAGTNSPRRATSCVEEGPPGPKNRRLTVAGLPADRRRPQVNRDQASLPQGKPQPNRGQPRRSSATAAGTCRRPHESRPPSPADARSPQASFGQRCSDLPGVVGKARETRSASLMAE